MLMNLDDLVQRRGLAIRGVLHCGAHLAEEAPTYRRLRTGPVTWIEANPRVMVKVQQALRGFPDQRLIMAALWERDGDNMTFHVTNYDGMSSSLLNFGTHPQFSPDTKFDHHIGVVTSTIDTLAVDHGIVANFLNMDLQGVELMVLRGAERFLKGVDYIMSEVNKAEVYEDCGKIWEMDELLTRQGFELVETAWVPRQGWGDALWVRV